MLEWIQSHEALFWSLFAVSVVTFLATLLAVPVLLVRLPRDYFAHDRRREKPRNRQHPAVRAVLIAARNLLGAVLAMMGLVMLLTPSQGLITLLVGLMLLDYPGKYQLERWIVSRPSVFGTVNWLRRRAGRDPLILDDDFKLRT